MSDSGTGSDPQGLDDALQQLRAEMEQTGVSAEHLVSDLVAVGLSREVYENATAALLVSASDVSRPVYPNARAAFEAAQDLLLMVAQDDYDETGAKAAVAEMLDRERSGELASEVFAALDEEDPTDIPDVEEQVEGTAACWDHYSPGKGELVRRVLPELRRARKSGRYHWSGLRRHEIHTALKEPLGGRAGTVELFRSMYNLLSFDAHPSPRIDKKHMSINEDEGLTLFLEPEVDPFVGMGMAAAFIAVEACRAALSEIRARRQAAAAGT